MGGVSLFFVNSGANGKERGGGKVEESGKVGRWGIGENGVY